MRKLIFLLFFSVLNTQLFGQQTNDWANRIKYRSHRPLTGFISGHVGDIASLTVDGQTFTNLRGLQPNYVPVPEINSIVFVTNSKDFSSTLHIFNMKTDEDTQLSLSIGSFGYSIGSGVEQSRTDSVKYLGSNLIALQTVSHIKNYINQPLIIQTNWLKVNLEKRKLVLREVVNCDTNGVVIQRFSKTYSD